MLYKDSKYHINYYDFVMYIKVKKINVHCFWIKVFFLCYLLLNYYICVIINDLDSNLSVEMTVQRSL